MKKIGEWLTYFAMIFLILYGAAQIIRGFGGDTDLLLSLMTSIFCGVAAGELAKDEKKDAGKT